MRNWNEQKTKVVLSRSNGNFWNLFVRTAPCAHVRSRWISRLDHEKFIGQASGQSLPESQTRWVLVCSAVLRRATGDFPVSVKAAMFATVALAFNYTINNRIVCSDQQHGVFNESSQEIKSLKCSPSYLWVLLKAYIFVYIPVAVFQRE